MARSRVKFALNFWVFEPCHSVNKANEALPAENKICEPLVKILAADPSKELQILSRASAPAEFRIWHLDIDQKHEICTSLPEDLHKLHRSFVNVVTEF